MLMEKVMDEPECNTKDSLIEFIEKNRENLNKILKNDPLKVLRQLKDKLKAEQDEQEETEEQKAESH